MKRASATLIGLAVLLGALRAPRAWAAGPKTSSASVIVDDLPTGSAGTVNATSAGGSQLDGSLGQTSESIGLSGGNAVEAGYFGALVSLPTSPSYLQINGSSVSIRWTDPGNPAGTAYAMDVATNAAFGGVLVSSSAFGASGVVPGLRGNTTYFARVSASYAQSDDSAAVSLSQIVTQALPPSAGSFTDAAPFVLRTAWDPLANSVGDIGGSWSALSSHLPAVRQGHAMVYYGGRLYVSGGDDGSTAQSGVFTAPVLADGSVGTWAATTPLPAIREAHAMAAWAGRLYVAGGSNGAAQSTVWWAPILADGTVGAWTATTPLPGPLTQLAMTATAGQLVVAGGDNGIAAQSNVYYAAVNDDGTLGAWTAAPSLPSAVSGHAMAVSSGALYVSGGTSGPVVNTVWWAPLTAGVPGTWSAALPLPTTLARHAMAAFDGKLYVTGGNDGSTVQGATYVGQLQSDQTVASWTFEAPLPGVYLHAMAASMDALYIVGGSNGGSPLNGVTSVPLSGTQSLAELATNAGFGTGYSSSSWRSGTNFDFSGLTPNTTYFSRVRARNYAGVATGVLSLGSTVTLAAVPLTAVSTFTDVEIGSITFQWSAGANPAGTQFLAQACVLPDFSASALASGWLTAATTGFSGLAVNTSYYLRVQARNSLNIVTPFALLGSTYTLAVPPVGSSITASNAAGLTLTWGASGNPANTFFEAQVSSMAGFIPLLQSSVTLSTSAAFGGLVSASTFYARVRALNGNGVPSAFDAVLSTSTGVDTVPPGVATGTFAYPGAAADSLSAGWTAPGDNGYAGTLFAGSVFYVQWSTSDPASVAWSTAVAQVVATTGPVSPGDLAGIVIAGLPDRQRVFLREWTRDLAGNYSAPSATFSAITTPFSYEPVAGGGGFDAGTSPSIAIDKSGNIHAAYRGTTGTQQLQYAKRTASSWGAPATVDPDAVSNVALALDPSDNPAIAYFDAGASQMKVARFLSGAWTLSVVETGNFLPGGAVVDAAGSVNVSYYDAAARHLKFARWTGVSWSTQTVDSGASDTGLQSALALDASQQPNISYYDATSHSLKFASATAGVGWSLSTVDGPGVFLSTGLAMTLDGNLGAHIAYADVAGNAVKYASRTVSGAWNPRVVESLPSLGGLRVGLALDGAGAASISYSDRVAAELKYAQWTGVAFSTQAIDLSSDDGLESSLALDGAGSVHIAYRDATNKALKAAHWTGALPGAFGGNARGRAQAPSAMKGAAVSTTSVQWSWTDNASNELGFQLYGSLVSTGPFALIAGTSTIAASPSVGGVKTYVESGLTTGTTYYRYAVAVGTGGFAAAGAAGAFPANVADAIPPTIVDNQTGDAVVRRQNTGLYNVNFFDTGGSHLSFFSVKASTVPGGAGPDLVAFSTAVVGINSDAYTALWPLPAAVFNALRGGVTNYITVQAVDGAGNATIGKDVFYVLRDTSVPSISGHVVEVSSQGITAVEVDCFDTGGNLLVTAFTAADGSGTYVLNGVPAAGTFRVQATWSVNGVGNSVSIDSIPVDASSVDFTLQLNYNLAAVQGNLQTLSLAPSAPGTLSVGARAAYFDPKAIPSSTQARIELFQSNRQVGMVPVPPGGHWIIPNLLPGRYKVRAYNGVDYTDFQVVDLVDGETKTLTFQYDPLPTGKVFAFPNPARRSATLRFVSTLVPLEAQIRIFDIAGNLVKEIGNSDVLLDVNASSPLMFNEPVYHATWDLTNSRGEGVASGVYLFAVKVKGGDNQSALVIKKLAVVK